MERRVIMVLEHWSKGENGEASVKRYVLVVNHCCNHLVVACGCLQVSVADQRVGRAELQLRNMNSPSSDIRAQQPAFWAP